MGILKNSKLKMAPTKKQNQPKKRISKSKKSATKKPRGRQPGVKKSRRGGKMFMKGHKQTYGRYIYKVLKQVHPDLRISSKAMSICDALCKDVESKMQAEMRTLCSIVGVQTCKSRQA